ncbi:MAG: carboxypeptidase regulatory-like domain-containing protein, partial [Acidobacteria bacterium]|nr:carboxypeptidase regulatory-like domain-containing protein [Acidobacteriota bacterium]
MSRKYICAICIGFFISTFVMAQAESNSISGTVLDQSDAVVRGASVSLVRVEDNQVYLTTTTDSRGHFEFKNVRSKKYYLNVRASGFAGYQIEQNFLDSVDHLMIRLTVAPLSQVVQVTATQHDFTTEATVSGRNLEERSPRDLAQSLRNETGVFAVRRGQINLDPNIRGLSENQIGMFVDGTRTFAAGPARMDSDLSHVSFHDVQEILITKGPYAFTEGAGTMSAVEVTTFSPPFYSDGFEVHGRGGFNYGENGVYRDGFGTIWAGNDKFRGSISHNTQLGNDYRAGDGSAVRGDFKSYANRATFGLKPSKETFLEYKFGFQEQKDIDYEGRLLDATYFITRSHALKFDYTPLKGIVSQVFGKFYSNNKGHLMNNNEKPTAQAIPGRIPPFGLDISLPTESKTFGGNYYAAINYKQYDLKFGGDFFNLDQNANRFVSRRDNGVLLFNDIVWGGANINDQGLYFNTTRRGARFSVGGTVRIDFVQANAARASDFFLANTDGDLKQKETNFSAAF